LGISSSNPHQLPRFVHRTRRSAGGGDGPQELLDLAGRDLASRTIAQGAMIRPGEEPPTPAVLAYQGQHPLGGLDLGECAVG
jgi:hypothetical protein